MKNIPEFLFILTLRQERTKKCYTTLLERIGEIA